MPRKQRVTYLKSYRTEGELKLPDWGYSSYDTSGVKRYHAAIYQLCGVTGYARDLIDWLTTQMDLNNIVHNDKHTKAAFIRFYTASANRPPSRSMVDASFLKLASKNLLLHRGKGTYMVNPEYFINSANEENRARLLKLVLEFTDDKDTTIRRESAPLSTDTDDAIAPE